MTDVTRRQAGMGALSMLAFSAFSAPIVTALAAFDAGDPFERQQADWIREIARLHAEFVRADRNFFVDQSAREAWHLAHHDLSRQSQILRFDPLGDEHTRHVIRSWLDTLYPSPAVRAYHVPKPLANLSPSFAERQAELDALTLELGEAEYRFAECKRQRRVPHGSKPYRELWANVSKGLRAQDTLSASFSRLSIETPDDKTAALRATMTYHGCYTVRGLNARRTWMLKSYVRA